ncbi:MAG: trigger factor [Syntrophomonadaceae bacterium]|nr:trigger factor [Syntrophomonadaceae bacterium]
MDARLEKIEKSEAYVEIEIDAATLEEGLEKAYRKVVKQVNIPGFRKGRVPRDLLEAHFGKEVLYEDAMEFIVPDAYEKAIDNLDIKAIAQPEFDIGEINPGQNLIVKVKVAVKPEVKLGKLEGLEISIPAMEITEADVDRRLEDMRAHYAKLVEKTDSPSELGDTVNINFVGSIDDVPFEGGTGEDYQLELGSNTFIPGFEEQLVGLKAGDTADVKVTFPATYHAEDLAGKDAVFHTTINKVECKELRELDDDLAQEVSDFDTLEALRNDIRENLIKANEYRQKEFKQKEVLSRALELSEIELAPAAVDAQFQNMLSQFEQRIQAQGISLEQYFQFTNSNLHQFREDMLPEAERNAKTSFMLEKIIEEKGFELTDAEIDKQIEEIAQQMGVEVDQAKQNLEGVMDKVKYNLKIDKAVEYLVDNAVVTETETESEAANPEGELGE